MGNVKYWNWDLMCTKTQMLIHNRHKKFTVELSSCCVASQVPFASFGFSCIQICIILLVHLRFDILLMACKAYFKIPPTKYANFKKLHQVAYKYFWTALIHVRKNYEIKYLWPFISKFTEKKQKPALSPTHPIQFFKNYSCSAEAMTYCNQ